MPMDLPNTETRVTEHTSERINQRLRLELEARIFYFARNPDKIDDRLAELDREWDIERVLETNAAGVSLFGILMASRNRSWLILPFTVAAFLMQHALQGWCPPVELFRRIGIRTTEEINLERVALKALRGDFDQVDMSIIEDPSEKARKALLAAERTNLRG